MNLSSKHNEEQTMRKDIPITVILLFAAALLWGCDAALSVGGRTVGMQSGKFVYADSSLKRHYNAPFDQVSKACEEALRDLKGTIVEKESGISTMSWTAILHEDKVRVVAEYANKEMTLVSVTVGLSANNTAALLIHTRIDSHLQKP
jgi:hypothetical protein